MNLLNWKKNNTFQFAKFKRLPCMTKYESRFKKLHGRVHFPFRYIILFLNAIFFHLFIFYFNRLIITGWFHIFSKLVIALKQWTRLNNCCGLCFILATKRSVTYYSHTLFLKLNCCFYSNFQALSCTVL